MAPRIQIPILILTGFLGSGKTSLLAKWLRAAEFEGAMVVVNELGEVGLDDRLVQHSSEVPLLLENGCACCEAAEDLNATLERLFWQRLHRQIPAFNWVLIETTGIAEPGPLLASLGSHQLVAERYRVHGIVTTFDARRGQEHLTRHVECRRQLELADTIILTKTDIATPAEQAAAIEAIASVRPDAEIVASARSSVTAGHLLATIDGLAARSGRHDRRHDHEHSPDRGHSHDHTGHGHAVHYTTSFAPLSASLDWDRLEHALRSVLDEYGADLLRLKGTARTGPGGTIDTIQAIAGEAFERKPLTESIGGKPVRVGLTVIARNTPAEAMASSLLARLGLPTLSPGTAADRGSHAHA